VPDEEDVMFLACELLVFVLFQFAIWKVYPAIPVITYELKGMNNLMVPSKE